MKVASNFATALSVFALISTGSIAASAQSNTPLDQINVDGANKTKNDNEYEGTILENPPVGVPGIVLAKEDLDRINPKDLQDIFANETSVSVGGSTAVSQKIFVYGIEDKNLAVSVDGAIQSNDLFHHTGTLLIDPSLLKAARVDPGVAPVDAGPGALGGSIQFETVDVKDLLEPGKTLGGFAKVSYDTNSKTFTTDVSGYTISNGFEALGYYKYANGENWDAGNRVEQEGTAVDLQSALGKLAYEAMTGDRFELSYEWVNDDALRPFRPNFGSVTFGAPRDPKEFNMSRNGFVFNYTDEKPNGWWDPKLVIAYSASKLEFLDLPFSTLTNLAETKTWSGKIENKFNISQGDIVAGVDFFHTDSEGGTLGDPAFALGTEKDRNIGLFTQARLDIMRNARLSFGGRVDNQRFTGVDGTDLNDTGFSGNISGEYDLNDIFTLKGGYAHVFGRIPLAEALLNYNDWDYTNVETFHSDNYTAGISAKYKGFTADVNYSVITIDDAIGHNAGFRSVDRNNTLDIKSKAFDVALGYKWDTGFVKAKYSNIDTTGDGEPISTTAWSWGTNMGELITLEASHQFEGTGITIGGDIQIALKQNDFSNIFLVSDNTPGNPLPAYEVVNAFIQYEPKSIPKITLRAEVNNIFNETYSDRATTGQDYEAFYVPLREPGRSVYLSAKAEF